MTDNNRAYLAQITSYLKANATLCYDESQAKKDTIQAALAKDLFYAADTITALSDHVETLTQVKNDYKKIITILEDKIDRLVPKRKDKKKKK